MNREDFGSREVFFLLLMSAIAIGLSWSAAFFFSGIVTLLDQSVFLFMYVITNGFG